MDAGWQVSASTPDFEWPPPANPSTMSSAASSPVHEEMIVDDCTPLDPGLEALLKDESEECDFVGFAPEDVENPYPDTGGGFSSGDSLPGSPGDLVIAESGSEAEGRGRRATSAAPSTASDASSASSRSKRPFDPSLPIYRKPFEFGFKRELVYRSTFDKTKDVIQGDIYYFPPSGRKLRSTVDVAKYLAEKGLPLAVESFTFCKEPLGINDATKEVIRMANVKYPTPKPVVKKPSVSPPKIVSPKIPQKVNGEPSRLPKRARKSTFQDPVWLTADVKSKGGLAPCGIHCIKAAGQVPSLQCSSCVCLYHPVCVGLTHLDSSILHGYVCTNCRPQKPSTTPKAAVATTPKPPPIQRTPQNVPKSKQKPSKGGGEAIQGLALLDGRQFVVVPRGPHLPPATLPPESALPAERKASAAEPITSAAPSRPLPTSFSTDLATRMSAMLHVFSFLTVKELLRASRVSSSWRLLAENRPLWRNVRFKNSGVRSWQECSQWLSRQGTEMMDLRKMQLPQGNDWWQEAAQALKQVSTLRCLEVCRCNGTATSILTSHCTQLEALSAASITPEFELDLEAVSQLRQLQRLRLRGANTPLKLINMPALQNLQFLTSLSITNTSPLPGEDVAQVLNNLPDLELLELGECGDMVQNAEILTEVIAKLQKLRRLRLEHLVSQQHNAELLVTFFESLTVLPKLQHLELVHVEAPPGCDQQLARLAPLKTLLLLPSFVHQGSITSQVLLRGVTQLVGLQRLVVGVTASICDSAHQLHQQKMARESPQQSPLPQPNDECIPVALPLPIGDNDLHHQSGGSKLDGIEVIPLWHLRRLLKESLPNASVDVCRLPHPSRFTLNEWHINCPV